MLVVPVVLLLVLVAVQTALWFHAVQLADHAASDGVAAAARYRAGAGDGAETAAAFVAEAGGRLAAPPTVVRSGGRVHVEVAVRVPRVVPGWPATVTRAADGPEERIVPEAQR